MKCIILYYELAKKAIVETSRKADRISYAFLKNETSKQMNALKQMKFQLPRQPKQDINNFFASLADEITMTFKKMMDNWNNLNMF